MPVYNKSIRNVLDADANTTANGGFLYATQAQALNDNTQLFIIANYSAGTQALYSQVFQLSDEVAGGAATASIKDSNGNFPSPTGTFSSNGVQTGFIAAGGGPGGGFSPAPLSTYGQHVALMDNVGLKHYYHSVQMGLAIDGFAGYGASGGGIFVDYMEDNLTPQIQQAGKGTGTWKANNIKMGDLRGARKYSPPLLTGDVTGFGGAFTNFLVGDPLNTGVSTVATGYLQNDAVDEQLQSYTGTSATVSIGGDADGI